MRTASSQLQLSLLSLALVLYVRPVELQVADTSTDLPHMLPPAAKFAAAADALGISNDSTVVVYDGLGIFSAPRAWWTFRAFGHERCGNWSAPARSLTTLLGVLSHVRRCLVCSSLLGQHEKTLLLSTKQWLCARRVTVLNGGFPAWQKEGLPVDESPVTSQAAEAAALAVQQAGDTRQMLPRFNAVLQVWQFGLTDIAMRVSRILPGCVQNMQWT